MITFAPFPIPVLANGQEGYVVYVESSPVWENDVITVALCESGQWRHFSSTDIKSYANATFGIKKEEK